MALILRTISNETGIVVTGDQAGPSRRLGVLGGALVGIVAAAILVSTAFPASAPKTLPAMSNSMGYWDYVHVTTRALPAVTHGPGFHERIQALASRELPPMSNSLGFWDFVSYPAARR